MPFETRTPLRRIAVIGGGISGMTAAHLLAPSHAVVLFESEPRLGGHAHTVVAGRRGDQPVDMGFIVFNRQNYPRLSALFDRLGVATVPTQMSFGASIQGGALEYGLRDLNALFAQRRNLVNPRHLAMLADILRFHARAEAALTPGMTIRELIAALRLSDAFRDHFLLPFSGAIWSTPCMGILDFPAETLVRFFVNHRLMSTKGHHQWETVAGGSVSYVNRLQAELSSAGVEIRLKTPVKAVTRLPSGVLLRAVGGEVEPFDAVVFACHSDQALAMLSDATPSERGALSAIRYQPNEVVLHSDPGQMPQSRRAWAAWTYVEPKGPRPDRIPLTYWMNALQPIPADDPLFVTLNPTQPIRDSAILEVRTFHHPLYDGAAQEAQRRLKALNGQSNTWFCGAWMGHGFHEDGFASAEDVAQALALRLPVAEAAE